MSPRPLPLLILPAILPNSTKTNIIGGEGATSVSDDEDIMIHVATDSEPQFTVVVM